MKLRIDWLSESGLTEEETGSRVGNVDVGRCHTLVDNTVLMVMMVMMMCRGVRGW